MIVVERNFSPLLLFVNDNEVIKVYLIVKTVQSLTECRHIFARQHSIGWSFIGALRNTARASLSLLFSRSLFFCRVKFMLHDFYVGTFFDYFSLSLLSVDCFFACIVISHVEFYYYFNMAFLFHLVLWSLFFHPKWCPRGIWDEKVEWYF